MNNDDIAPLFVIALAVIYLVRRFAGGDAAEAPRIHVSTNELTRSAKERAKR